MNTSDTNIKITTEHPLHEAVSEAVNEAVNEAVTGAVNEAVNEAVTGAVNEAVNEAVTGVVNDAVNEAVSKAVNETTAKKKVHLEFTNQYLTVCFCAVVTFAACLIIFKFLNNWRDIKGYIGSIMSTMSPFLIAFLIAYFINPLATTVDRLLFDRLKANINERFHLVLSLVISYFVFVGAIITLMTFVLPQIVESILKLIRQSGRLYVVINNAINTLSTTFPDIDFNYIQNLVDGAIPDAIKTIQGLMSDVVPVIYNASLSIIGWVVNIILAFVISCYLMTDKKRLLLGLKRITYSFFDEETAYKILVTIKGCNKIVSGYIIGKSIDSLIIGILCFVFMTLLGLPYQILISVLVGVTNMIPYFGPFIGAVPGILILIIVSPKYSLIFLVLILVLQQFDGAILGPKILGDSTGLSPIWIIFAITVGGALGGVLGMFLGVPFVSIMVYLCNNIMDYMLYKRRLQPNLSNVVLPDINHDNVLIPKDFIEEEPASEGGKKSKSGKKMMRFNFLKKE